MPHPFRFSIGAGAATTRRDVLEVARMAEDLGYGAVTMPDHLNGTMATIPTLTAIATVTETLKVTPLVVGNDYRHPAWLAQEAATLDLLSDGRLELGVGAGWMLTDYEQTGLGYDRPSVRIARLAEAITIMKGAFTDDPFSFEGEHYSIAGLDLQPKPVQRPHPPFLVAGGGRKVLTLAAREAQIVGINPGLAAGVIDERAGPSATPDATDQKIAWVREAAGDRFDAIELQTRVHLAMISDDREGMAEALAPALGISSDDALASPHALVGTVEQCIETIHGWRERWGISYISLSADQAEAFAPVVAALT